MSDTWWDDPEPLIAGHTSAEIDAITADAIATEPPLPAATTALLSWLPPTDQPLMAIDVGEPLRGLVLVCRDHLHAATVNDAAAIAGVRVETWAAHEVASVLKACSVIGDIKAHWAGAVVRRRAGRLPAEAIPFGGPE